ncbi:MAG: hypothetical protein M3300_00770 [Actinomycetota bacterium]|jgi:hypothetical protein|nr:hypothetical protein [Actinomycetota bacterium]
MRLQQTGRIVLIVQALLIAVLAVAGLLAVAGSPTDVGRVVGFTFTVPHSVLLLALAAVSVLAALGSRLGRFWAMTQAGIYTLLFVIATAASTGHSQDTWLRLNTADHFLHLGLALLNGVMIPTLFWPTAPGKNAPIRMVPGEQPPSGQRSEDASTEESAETRDMIAAEVAVTENHATPEQLRRVQEDAQRRADAQHREAWKHYEESEESTAADDRPAPRSAGG